jgi:cell division protein FtsN
MKTNNLLTWLLYALLLGLISLASYKACQMQKEKKQLREQQEAELQQTLRDLGYTSGDTTASQGSTFKESTEKTGTTPATKAADKNGIEDEPVSSSTKTTTPPASTNPNVAPPAKTVAPTESTTAKSPTKTAPAAPKKTKFRVQAGSFTRMAGARERLEQVIKLGYPNAEIAKTNNGKYAVVVVFRTNNKQEAVRIMDQLEAKGVDATVMEN